MRNALGQTALAFRDAPRPCREMHHELVESEYAALSFVSAGGFRPFIPAYMCFTLRNLDSGAAAVDSTI